MANVDVYSNGKVGGQLSNTGGNHVYTYRHDAEDAVSITMPLRHESYRYSGLHPIFQMNLPEGVLRDAIVKATAKRFGSDDLTMLTLLGSNQIGRLAYALEGKGYPANTANSQSLHELLASSDAELFSQLLSRFAMQSGVAGVQPKVLMDIPDNTLTAVDSKLTLPLKAYIVKSWGPEYPELACNEFVCLTLAQAAGLNVADFSVSDNGKLLVTKRFDVVESKGGDERQLLGFEDFCVLQGLGTKEKYDASIESCANTIGQFVSAPYKKQALYDFFKLTLINNRVRNGDAHLKNIGVLYSDLRKYKQGVNPQFSCRMAPAFDIVSTVPYIPSDTMALSLTGSKRWPKWSVLNAFAKQHCNLNSKDVDHCVSDIEQASVKALTVLDDLANKQKGFEPIAEVMRRLLTQNG